MKPCRSLTDGDHTPSGCSMPEVLILGGGLAGNLVARLLRRELPEVGVTIVEALEQAPRKVGESVVEGASKFLVQRLGLGTMLYREHLPKSGLRFYFGDGPLEHRSEIGLDSFGFHPSFQLDRARLEEALLAANKADGVQILRGWKVRELSVQLNRVEIAPVGENGAPPRTLSADWLIDATGRRRLLARALDLVTATPHTTQAKWVWLRGVADLDQLGSADWQARFRHTARGLATCHFLSSGAWSWLIPLPDGLTSYGQVAVGSQPLPDLPELFDGTEVVQKGQIGRLAHGSRRIFGPGWAMIGDAAFSTDPLYSPGLDYVTDQADQIVELIRHDGAPELLSAFEAWQQQRFTAGMLLVQDQYPVLGDYDLFRVRQVLDVGSYYNLLSVWSERDHLDPRWISHFMRFAQRGNEDLFRLGQRFAALAKQHPPRHNHGCWDLSLPPPALQERFGDARRLSERLRYQQRLVAEVDAVLNDLPGRGPGEEQWIRPFFDRLGG